MERERTGRLVEVGEVGKVFRRFEEGRIAEGRKDIGRVGRGGFGNGGKGGSDRVVLSGREKESQPYEQGGREGGGERRNESVCNGADRCRSSWYRSQCYG
jgi:hypothetical protein